MARLELSFLGRWQVSLDGGAETGFESSKVRALLTYLAVEAERPHYRETLAGLLWPSVPEATALASLRQALANLRKNIGDQTATPPFLLITRTTIQFNRASNYRLDVTDFAALLDACDRHTHRHVECCRVCVARLQQATNLYRGGFLEDLFLSGSVEFEDWALLMHERLRQRASAALERLARYYERRADYELARQTLSRQLELDPWYEEGHRRLMRVLARSGRRSAALAQYETCRRLLNEELGVEAAPETVALHERIKSGAFAENGLSAPAPLLNWPHSATALIGREAELAELAELIGNPDCRLLTILSPGGMGKSRLALEVVKAEAWSFEDGAAFVPLAPLSSADYLPATMAQALGLTLSSQSEPRELLIHNLRGLEILIVLDSFEHVREGTGLLTELLAEAPRVKVVVTSRERLDVEGEWLLELGGLRYPDTESTEHEIEGYSGVQLFVHCARRAQSTFTMSKSDALAIRRICQMVGGMPLAIELAAAWVRVISCAEIASELERGLEFLTTSRRDIASRHRSLRALFDNSWQRLSAEEQRAFVRLSVFRGGFERDAAEQVAGVTLALLSALVDKTLLRWDWAGRYDMHELIAEYASEKLRESGEEHAVRARHSGYVLQLAELAEPALRGPEQRIWLDRLDAERNNVRATLQWTLTADGGRKVGIGLRIASALAAFWWMRGMREGRDWLAKLLEHPVGRRRTPLRAKALALAADLAVEQEGAHQAARTLYEECLSIANEFGDRQGVAVALLGLGRVASTTGEVASARALSEQSLAIWRELDERWGIAWALHCLGDLAFDRVDLAMARLLYDECLVIRQAIGDSSGVAWIINKLGELARYDGDYTLARALNEEGLRLHRDVGNKVGVTASLCNLAYIALNQGQQGLARALFEESLSENFGHVGLNALCLVGLARMVQQPTCAARLLGAAEPFRRGPSSLADRADHERIVAAVRAQLDEATFAVAWEAGRSMSLSEALELALQNDRLEESG